uniref:Gremlin-1 n=1 Tax=Anolis carolinensis TaxID=28377 RepID=A0A803TXI9_ANOCA
MDERCSPASYGGLCCLYVLYSTGRIWLKLVSPRGRPLERMDCRVPIVQILILLGFLLLTVKGETIQATEGVILDEELGKMLANDRELAQEWLVLMNSSGTDEEKVKTPPLQKAPESNSDTVKSDLGTFYITKRDYVNQGWCKTQTLKQTIHEEGCNSYSFINRFCYGQCNSFYIPWHINDERGVFQSCSFCKPKKFITTSVTLHCPDRLPPRMRKKIRQVVECQCMTIHLD